MSGRKVPDLKNLPLTAFPLMLKSFPNHSDPENALEAYNLMQGLGNNGSPIINSVTGQVTKFAYSGDPVQGTGWTNNVHSDKRILLSSGPFTLADSDTQEVVAGIVIAQGQTGLESVSLLKRNAELAQILYDANFETAPPPPSPNVSVFSEENVIS